MPEWSNGAVSKTVVLLAGTGGSNPPLSATPLTTRSRRLRVVFFQGVLKASFHKLDEKIKSDIAKRDPDFERVAGTSARDHASNPQC